MKTCVPAAHLAARILVPARSGDDTVGVFLVDPNGSGVRLERQVTTTGEPQSEMTSVGRHGRRRRRARRAATGGAAIVDWLLQRAISRALRHWRPASPSARCA